MVLVVMVRFLRRASRYDDGNFLPYKSAGDVSQVRTVLPSWGPESIMAKMKGATKGYDRTQVSEGSEVRKGPEAFILPAN